MVLYRKYRPQTIRELDCQSVRKRLETILASDYIPHAFLFSGSKGSGKTSAARILAKVFNCEKRRQGSGVRGQELKKEKKLTTKDQRPTTDIEPCNACETCKAITDGRHLDVMEIDAASNRGIDDIRTLRENIKLAPISATMKVYVIDEVHMLTNEAFNALLKTLEEPPAHAVFIMATTEPDKVPETIRSRATHIQFPKATREEILHALMRVVNGEKATLDANILEQIAGSADGSFRDATKLLEQILAEGATTASQAATLLGGGGTDVEAFLSAFGKKDVHMLLLMIEDMKRRGIDMKGFVIRVVDTLHMVFLAHHGIPPKDAAVTQSSLDSVQTIQILKLLSRVFTEIKVASRPEIPLEIAAVEWCTDNSKVKS